jgi:hypothetical protein
MPTTTQSIIFFVPVEHVGHAWHVLLLRCVVFLFRSDVKLIQREAAARSPTSGEYDYIRDEIADRLVDRLLDINRDFKKVLDLGCHSGHILKALQKQAHRLGESDTFMGIESLTQVDRSGENCQCQICLNRNVISITFVFPFRANAIQGSREMVSTSLLWFVIPDLDDVELSILCECGCTFPLTSSFFVCVCACACVAIHNEKFITR